MRKRRLSRWATSMVFVVVATVFILYAVMVAVKMTQLRADVQTAHAKLAQVESHADACSARAQALFDAFERQKKLTLDMVTGITPSILVEQRSITAAVGDAGPHC